MKHQPRIHIAIQVFYPIIDPISIRCMQNKGKQLLQGLQDLDWDVTCVVEQKL